MGGLLVATAGIATSEWPRRVAVNKLFWVFDIVLVVGEHIKVLTRAWALAVV